MNKGIKFVKEAIGELKKVTWLGKKEVLASTLVISVLVTIVAIFIGFVDFILSIIIRWVL